MTSQHKEALSIAFGADFPLYDDALDHGADKEDYEDLVPLSDETLAATRKYLAELRDGALN